MAVIKSIFVTFQGCKRTTFTGLSNSFSWPRLQVLNDNISKFIFGNLGSQECMELVKFLSPKKRTRPALYRQFGDRTFPSLAKLLNMIYPNECCAIWCKSWLLISIPKWKTFFPISIFKWDLKNKQFYLLTTKQTPPQSQWCICFVLFGQKQKTWCIQNKFWM